MTERIYQAGNLQAKVMRYKTPEGIFRVSIFRDKECRAIQSEMLGKDFRTWADAEDFVKREFRNFSQYDPITRIS